MEMTIIYEHVICLIQNQISGPSVVSMLTGRGLVRFLFQPYLAESGPSTSPKVSLSLSVKVWAQLSQLLHASHYCSWEHSTDVSHKCVHCNQKIFSTSHDFEELDPTVSCQKEMLHHKDLTSVNSYLYSTVTSSKCVSLFCSFFSAWASVYLCFERMVFCEYLHYVMWQLWVGCWQWGLSTRPLDITSEAFTACKWKQAYSKFTKRFLWPRLLR